MIKPCGHRLLIKLAELKEVDDVMGKAAKAGIILPDEHPDIIRQKMAVDKGTVLSIGDTAFKDYGGGPWCKVGDVIAFAKYSGKSITDLETNEKFLVINDEDVVAILKESE